MFLNIGFIGLRLSEEEIRDFFGRIFGLRPIFAIKHARFQSNSYVYQMFLACR